MTGSEILEAALQKVNNGNLTMADLRADQFAWVRAVVGNAETQKAVLAALLTSLTKTIESASQDVRLHKIEMAGGYSGRSFDTNHVTPFIARHLPRLAMKSGSGWLIRSRDYARTGAAHFR